MQLAQPARKLKFTSILLLLYLLLSTLPLPAVAARKPSAR